MNNIDWIVLFLIIIFISVYGYLKTSKSDLETDYFIDRKSNWFTIAISMMATQASAITFLSVTGQGFLGGLGFVQFYFSMPLALYIITYFFLPFYKKYNLVTAYQFLEKRFDIKVRVLVAFLFLLHRGLACGFTILAPSIVLSTVLNINIFYTNVLLTIFVVIYTSTGGSVAVSKTQKLQMFVIFIGMFYTLFLMLSNLPENIGLKQIIEIGDIFEKNEIVSFKFDLNDKYNIWSAMLGGIFLFVSYFGTDQSQVQRYIGNNSQKNSQSGILLNGFLKIPMQLSILFVGVVLFVFFIFNKPPIHFNLKNVNSIQNQEFKNNWEKMETNYNQKFNLRKELVENYLIKNTDKNEIISKIKINENEIKQIKINSNNLIKKYDESADTNDSNYIFMYYIINYLPNGFIGLLIAVILCASMSSTSSELSSLTSITMIDLIKRFFQKENIKNELIWNKLITFFWGVYAFLFAQFVTDYGTLIEAVNILGSLFYGTILGVFLVGFFFTNIKTKETIISIFLSFLLVLFLYFEKSVAFLWFNLIGCLSLILFAFLFKFVLYKRLNN